MVLNIPEKEETEELEISPPYSVLTRVTGRVGILLKNLVVGTVLGAELGYGIGFAPNGPSKKLLPLPASAANPAKSSTLRGC